MNKSCFICTRTIYFLNLGVICLFILYIGLHLKAVEYFTILIYFIYIIYGVDKGAMSQLTASILMA